VDLPLEHASHSGNCLVTGSPIMFGLFTLDKDEVEREKVIVIRTGLTSKDLSISANSASKSLLDATCVVG
jgi:hypothetical protein